MSESIIVDAAIVVPWRTAKGREKSFEIAWKYNNLTFADFKVYFSDSVGDRFNVSEARNRGCIQAIEDGYKYLVVMDADTIFERSAVVDALKVVSEEEVISYIYTWSVELDGLYTDALESGQLQLHEAADRAVPTLKHVGSGWAMTSEIFWKMNGWDENFHGWGYEDTAFQKAYQVLLNNEMSRVPGTCYRLWHPDRDTSSYDNNLTRYNMLYDIPRNTPKKMRSALSNNMLHRLSSGVE